MLAINARFRQGPQTGVQRVAAELLPRLGVPHREITPSPRWATGLRGHAWEQLALPRRAAGMPLWSPCNSGPLAIANQVVTLHDAAVFDHPEWFTPNFVRLYRRLWPALARRARRVVTVSEYSRGRLAEALAIPASRIEVVWNGVSELFRPQADETKRAVCERYGVAPGRYFATLSTIEPRKNLPLVLDAWASARRDLPPDTKLLLIGGGGAAHIFAGSAVDGLDAGVVRSGYVPDAELPALLGGASALLYPSRYEGFGLPVLEAMACAVPVVTTALTSIPEVGGEVALYVDPDRADELAAAMLRLAREPSLRADLGAAGRERARRFSWRGAAEHMRTILVRDLGVGASGSG